MRLKDCVVMVTGGAQGLGEGIARRLTSEGAIFVVADINTASIAGRQGYAEFTPYCASKASVISLTQASAREFAKHKIAVNMILV